MLRVQPLTRLLVLGAAFGLASASAVSAADNGNVFQFLQSVGNQLLNTSAPAYYAPRPTYQVYYDRRDLFPRSMAAPRRRPAPSAAMSPWKHGSSAGKTRSAGVTGFCVRTCDGFFFPASAGTRGDAAAMQESCSQLCPTAETHLYLAPKHGGGIAQATYQKRPYTDLSTAYGFQRSFDKTCTCSALGIGLTEIPVGDDGSIRRGDMVMTETGVKAYIGGKGTVGDRTDGDVNAFVPVSAYGKLSKVERAYLVAIGSGRLQNPSPAPVGVSALQPVQRLASNEGVRVIPMGDSPIR